MNADHENNNEFVYDTLKLLQLLESISTTTESTILQSKINLYLKDLLSVEYVLIVPLLPANEDTQEGLIQVVNDNVLEKEFRFSVSFYEGRDVVLVISVYAERWQYCRIFNSSREQKIFHLKKVGN